MSAPFAADHAAHPTPTATPQHIAAVRAVVALLWAAAVVVAVGDGAPSTDSAVPVAAALLLAGYPVIDAVASFLSGREAGAAGATARVNGAISVVAVVAIGVAAFGFDAGATLVAFGAWAAITGALQLGLAVHRRRAGRQLPMIISGGLSTVAGLSFVAAAGGADAHLATLGGYMALGGILYLVWAARTRTAR